MFERIRKTPLVLAMSILTVFATAPLTVGEDAAPSGQPEVVELGRQFKAMPWLQELGDVPYEVVPFDTIPLLSGFPRTTNNYEIDPEVVVSAYSYFFCVRSPDAVYVVGSVVNLAKLCRELEVMAEIKERNKGKEFASGVGDGLKGIGTGLSNLVRHPGLSMKSVGTRIRQTGRSLERAVGAEEKVGKDESGANRSHLGEGPAGQERRHLAFDLGVDVYTSNPVLQKALVEMSQLRVAGGLTTWAIPYHIGMLDNFNPIFGDEKTELRIRDFSPYELRRLVGEDLEPVFGMNREDGTRPLHGLLYNPNYTPRSIAYIGLDFEHLGLVEGRELILMMLSGADTPEEADMLSLELRLYSFLHRRIEPIRKFVPFKNIFIAVGDSGKMYLLTAADTIRPWKHTADTFGEVLREAVDLGVAGLEIWVLGDVNPEMVANAANHGVTIRQNILREPQFFPKPEQRITGE